MSLVRVKTEATAKTQWRASHILMGSDSVHLLGDSWEVQGDSGELRGQSKIIFERKLDAVLDILSTFPRPS